MGGSWREENEKEGGVGGKSWAITETRKELYTLLFGRKEDKKYEVMIESVILN